jgi:hypothetical protein
LFFLLTLVGISAIAQDSWKLCLDKKVLPDASSEAEKKNVVTISVADLNKTKVFTLTYREKVQLRKVGKNHSDL